MMAAGGDAGYRVGGTGGPARNVVHAVLSLGAVSALWLLPAGHGRAVLVAAAVVAVSTDLIRLQSSRVSHYFLDIFGRLLRADETHRFCRATSLAVGFGLTALIFPAQLAVAGMLYAGIADPAASWVGRRFGRHRFRNGKSVEGSTAFFIVAVGVGILLPGLGIAAALAVASLLAALELGLGGKGENLLLPIAGTVAVWMVASCCFGGQGGLTGLVG